MYSILCFRYIIFQYLWTSSSLVYTSIHFIIWEVIALISFEKKREIVFFQNVAWWVENHYTFLVKFCPFSAEGRLKRDNWIKKVMWFVNLLYM